MQVVCVTDGQDNCSPNELRSLKGLVDAIKKIVGSDGNFQIYRPMSDPQERCMKDDVVGRNALLWALVSLAPDCSVQNQDKDQDQDQVQVQDQNQNQDQDQDQDLDQD